MVLACHRLNRVYRFVRTDILLKFILADVPPQVDNTYRFRLCRRPVSPTSYHRLLRGRRYLIHVLLRTHFRASTSDLGFGDLPPTIGSPWQHDLFKHFALAATTIPPTASTTLFVQQCAEPRFGC